MTDASPRPPHAGEDPLGEPRDVPDPDRDAAPAAPEGHHAPDGDAPGTTTPDGPTETGETRAGEAAEAAEAGAEDARPEVPAAAPVQGPPPGATAEVPAAAPVHGPPPGATADVAAGAVATPPQPGPAEVTGRDERDGFPEPAGTTPGDGSPDPAGAVVAAAPSGGDGGAPVEPRDSPPAADAPSEAPADTVAPAAAAGLEPDEAVAAPGEQIEWQPVVAGDQIEWHPVMASDAVEDAEGAAPAHVGPEFDTPDTGGTVNGNGTGSPSPAPAAARAHPAGERRPRTGPPRRPRTAVAGTEARPTGTASPATDARAKTRRQVILLSVLSAVVVLVAVLGVVLSRGAAEKGTQAQGAGNPATATTTPPITVPPSEMTTFRDEQAEFTFRYPRAWRQIQVPVGDIRVVLEAGEYDAVWVRVIPINTPATEENIGNFKAVTDTIVFGDQKNRLIQEQLVRLNGRLTYYYLYTFPDEVTGQEGVHAHYFVFEGQRMYSLVFQSVPAEDFPKQAFIFDQVAESFVPEVQGSTTPTTR